MKHPVAAYPFTVRTMTRDDLDVAVEWAAAEGWNPGLYDGDVFYETDPQGFLAGEVNGELMASISAISYGDKFGFIGFFIVHPEYREKGYGIQLWKAAMAKLSGRNVGLDGVVAQQENYAKSGFKLAYRNIRFETVSAVGKDTKVSACLVPLSSLPFDSVNTYDVARFPAPRPVFLQHWISRPATVALGYVQDGDLRGYGVIRPCRTGYKIGPLFGESEAVADELFRALLAHATGEKVYLDPPEPNALAMALVKRYGMTPVFETARMYTGPMPEVPLSRIFGVTSFELG